MNEATTATWTTYVRGEKVELPATIDSVRAALPQDRLAEFDAEIGGTPGQDLHRVLGRWALETHPEAKAEMTETFEQLEAGDATGVASPYGDTEGGAA